MCSSDLKTNNSFKQIGVSLRDERPSIETLGRAAERLTELVGDMVIPLEQEISKAEMARRMQTSRAALNRLLDPENDAVTLATLRKAAEAVGREIRLELV